MCHPVAQRSTEAQPTPFGEVRESSPLVAQATSFERSGAGKMPGRLHPPAHPAISGKVVWFVNESRVPSAQPAADPFGFAQTPPLQVSKAPHLTPHAPQLLTSSPSCTHTPKQSLSPAAHAAAHFPLEQT